ncbi:MAG: SsrA-binding protein SmpB [Spirochaetaceae bacterium]|nr:MAG: SsrA-binding protein SmpB [Spirochaetaceae bacterium]
MAVDKSATKQLGRNRRAFYDYAVDETLECGVVLTGTEVKSIRANKFSFSDAYGRIRNNELWLIGLHISEYSHGNLFNHEPLRERKLLAHRREIAKLRRKVDERGFTLIPLTIYLKGGRIKIELGVCRGKKNYDKREGIKERDQRREVDREIRIRS